MSMYTPDELNAGVVRGYPTRPTVCQNSWPNDPPRGARFARSVLAPIVALALAFALGAFVASHRTERPSACTMVAPSAEHGTIPTGWEFERVDDTVGQWYSPDDVLEGWARTEDSAVFTTRDCATR